MTLSPEDLEAVFQREHRFREAILSASKAAQPKPPSIWPSVLQFALKSIPADLVKSAVVDGGKAILAGRKAAEEDQPIVEELPKAAPRQHPAGPEGRPKEPDNRSRVTFVSTFVEPEKPVPKPE